MALLRAALEPEPISPTSTFGRKQWTNEQIHAANNTLSAANELADAVQALLVAKGARAKRETELRSALANFVDVRDRADNLDDRIAPIENRLLEIEREYEALIRAVEKYPGLLREAV